MKFPEIAPKEFLLWLAICLAGGALFSSFSALPFWAGSLIVAFALVFNGFVAEVEDNSPGGLNYPDSQSK